VFSANRNIFADIWVPQFKAAQLLRLAETNGAKTLGNSWYVPEIFHIILSTRDCFPMRKT